MHWQCSLNIRWDLCLAMWNHDSQIHPWPAPDGNNTRWAGPLLDSEDLSPITNCCWSNVYFFDIIGQFYWSWTEVNVLFSFKMNSYLSTVLAHHQHPLSPLVLPYPQGLETKRIFSLLSPSIWLPSMIHSAYVSLTSPRLAIFSAPALV